MNRESCIVFVVLLALSSMGGCAGCNQRVPSVAQSSPPTQVMSDPDGTQAAPPARTIEGSLATELVPQFSKIQTDVDGNLNVLLKLTGGSSAQTARRPLDLAVVIDTSGSMSGEKMDSVKIAVLELLKQLGQEDRVSLITYANNVQTLETRIQTNAVGLTTLKNRVLAISPSGGTALGPGLLTGLSLLESSKEPERISHLLLLSDGLANIGESRSEVLGNAGSTAFERGISISTLGVGLDYNEDLMTHVADQGGGQYHFIDDNQRIVSVLQDELKGLTAAVAREIQITLHPKEGVTVDKVFGYPAEKQGDMTVIKVGSLRANQNREIIFRILYSAFPADTAQRRLLSDAEIKYKNVADDDRIETRTATLEVATTRDTEAVRLSENTEVTVRTAEVEGASQLALAARAVETGDFTQAESLLDGSISALRNQASRVPSKALDEQIIEMEKAKTDISSAKSSASEQKYYVKKAKSSAYTKSKSSGAPSGKKDKALKK